MAPPRVLIVEGNTARVRARHIELGGRAASAGYAELLRELEPRLRCDIVYPADAEPELPTGHSLADYDGLAVTGSALNVYAGGLEIERQVALTRAAFAVGLPIFGSCWGLQIAVTAAGGRIRLNPNGREFGIARRLLLTGPGRAHPMFAGKPDVFEAIAVHSDDVEVLPAGAVVLAGNELSAVQAASFRYDKGICWGTQYHPEYSFHDIAATARRYGEVLVQDGKFESVAALGAYADEVATLDTVPMPKHLAWRHGLGPALAHAKSRYAELINWLGTLVLPRCAARS